MNYPSVVANVGWSSGPILTSVQEVENYRLHFPGFFTSRM